MGTFQTAFGFFHWAGISHYINLLFVFFLLRSGWEILSAHPKLYWRDDCRPGSEWARFTRRELPKDRLWTSADEEESFSPILALPGRRHLGMGRHWHFFSVLFWVTNGLVYVALLSGTGEWRRLIPTSWSVFPEAARTAWIYLHFHLPPRGDPYNPLQQLSYAAVVFLLAPLLIATGAALSPALTARFPGYLRLFGGRQPARSIHFLCLVAMALFILVHVAMVLIDDFPRNMAFIIHGGASDERTAVIVGLAGLGGAVLLHVAATVVSLREPRFIQRALGVVIEPVRHALLHRLSSRQHYSREEISPFFRVNGAPPSGAEYQALAADGFRGWRLEVTGMVENPLSLSLDELRALPRQAQVTKHNCIQGWSAVAEWTGVPVAELLARCRPTAEARYLVFHAFDEPKAGHHYYETLDLALARAPQTLLAYEMNGAPLPVPHGAPCRLRVETQLGFKMVKYLRSIELVADYRPFGEGQGGYREDVQNYGPNAGI